METILEVLTWNEQGLFKLLALSVYNGKSNAIFQKSHGFLLLNEHGWNLDQHSTQPVFSLLTCTMNVGLNNLKVPF